MDILGRKAVKRIYLLAGAIILSIFPSVQTYALGGELYYGRPDETNTKAVVLEEMGESYQVKEGDSLWKIARNMGGTGEDYWTIYQANQDVVTDPDLIYPGMVLNMNRPVYLNKISETSSVGMGKYGFCMFPGWTVGIDEMGQSAANFVLFLKDSQDIVCLIQDKLSKTEETLQDWELCQEEIRQYAEENYAEQIEDLTFLQYQTEAEENIYLYYYTYLLDLTALGGEGTYPVNVCVGIRLTDSIQAEYIYYGLEGQSGLEEIRYVTATFYEEEGMENTSVNDQNIQLTPQVQWPLEGMVNSFGWIEAAFTLPEEPEKTPEDLLRRPLSR